MNKELIPTEKADWTKILLAFLLGGLIFSMALSLLIFTGNINSFMTDGQCDKLVVNGTYNGMDSAISIITQQAVQCKQIPINYKNYNYTLIAIECLDLNTIKEEKKTWQQ
jgi:hypothetical protein